MGVSCLAAPGPEIARNGGTQSARAKVEMSGLDQTAYLSVRGVSRETHLAGYGAATCCHAFLLSLSDAIAPTRCIRTLARATQQPRTRRTDLTTDAVAARRLSLRAVGVLRSHVTGSSVSRETHGTSRADDTRLSATADGRCVRAPRTLVCAARRAGPKGFRDPQSTAMPP